MKWDLLCLSFHSYRRLTCINHLHNVNPFYNAVWLTSDSTTSPYFRYTFRKSLFFQLSFVCLWPFYVVRWESNKSRRQFSFFFAAVVLDQKLDTTEKNWDFFYSVSMTAIGEYSHIHFKLYFSPNWLSRCQQWNWREGKRRNEIEFSIHATINHSHRELLSSIFFGFFCSTDKAH